MISLFKKGAILLLAFFAFNNANAQLPTKLLFIDSINQLEPIIMFDSTDFYVHVVVDDTSFVNNDSIFGNLIYYYLTDSMDTAGASPRIIDNDPSNIWIAGSIGDIVSVDIRPDEIRTSPPINLIILWPAMVQPGMTEVSDSDSVAVNVTFEGYLSLPPTPGIQKGTILFPTPALQVLYIKPEEIDLIQRINILTMEGKLINTYEYLEYKSGFINIDTVPRGSYLVELNYKNGEVIRTKIIKH